MTMTLIATTTVGAGGASSIDFTSIPATYTDLLVVFSIRTSNAVTKDDLGLRFNAATTSYSDRYLYGNGATTNSGTDATPNELYGGIASGSSATAATFGSGSIYVPNYAGSTNKSISVDAVNENNATTAFQFLIAGLWSNTSTITSLSLRPYGGTGTLAQYSTASLYGITKGSGGATVSP